MGQVLHGPATTMHATRAKIQKSEASIREIAKQYNINPKAVRKWGVPYKENLYAYVLNYNFNLKLRAIGRRTAFGAILDSYQKTPDIFIINPNHLIVGLNN